jgi:DNA helicase-2/ATP-dependent DNA helicase PcrA
MGKFQLTPEQEQVVDHFGSPLRVLAGPGTGKTFCVVERIKRLVFNKKIPFNQICAITFTTAAADELRTRLEGGGFKPDAIPYVNTLHGLATRILRKHIKKTGLRKNFRPIDKLIFKIMTKDIRQDLIEKKVKLKITKIRTYLNAYYQEKSEAGLPVSIQKDKDRLKVLRKIERSYCDNLDFYNVIDWHDILHKSLDLLETYKDICSEFHKMTKFLLVDEYQDLSPLEQRFVRTICGDYNGLCIVGDDDQSIYETFRYADPRGIINFCSNHGDATALYLTKCRRCPPRVIEYALKVIKNNKNRVHDKTLVPFNPKKKGFAVIFEKRSKKAEIEWVANKVEECIQKGYKPKDVMVLFTDGKVAQGYIAELLAKNIPLNIQLKVSHTFKTDCFLWLLATLRWLVNNGDNLSLRQCLDYWEGIGPETVYQLRSLAISLDDNMWDVIKNVSSNQAAFKKIRQRKKVLSFSTYIKTLKKVKKFSAIVDTFVNYIPRAKDDKGCKILHDYLQGFDDIEEISLKDLLSDFEEKLESGELENQCIQEEEGVRIMSMHSAKGCEAPIVFMPALEHDIIPGLAHNVEEKRRLFYVSLTRAKVGVFLTWAKQRTGQEIHIVNGRRMLGKKRSVFLDEILLN